MYGSYDGHQQRVFLQGVSLSVLPDAQQRVIRGIRRIEQEITPETTGEKVKAMMADAFPPEHLFDADVADHPIMYQELCVWLCARGADLGSHSSGHLIYLLADGLYAGEEDRGEANYLARQLLQRRAICSDAGRAARGDAAAPPHASAAGQPTPIDSLADLVEERYSGDARKFSGARDEAVHEYIADYQRVCCEYGLTHAQCLQCMHNMFAGEAKRFYDIHVEGAVVTFAEAVQKLNDEYNSPARQAAVKWELASLRVSILVAKGQTEMAALTSVHQTISKLAPQLPPSHRGDAHLVDFLHRAVVGMPWAFQPLCRIATNGLSFSQLHGELSLTLQLHEEARAANTKNESMLRMAASSRLSRSILLSRQGLYARPSRVFDATHHQGRAGGSSSTGRPSVWFDPLTAASCFNCDQPSHTIRQCPQPIQAVKAAQRKLASIDENSGSRITAATVLFQLCEQLDGPPFDGGCVRAGNYVVMGAGAHHW